MSPIITVPEELKKRLERLAFLLDMPQHKILERLLDLFEQDLSEGRDQLVDRDVVDEMRKAEVKIEAEDPEWTERSRKIEMAARRGLTPELFKGSWRDVLDEDDCCQR